MLFCGEFSGKVSPDFQSCGLDCFLLCRRRPDFLVHFYSGPRILFVKVRLFPCENGRIASIAISGCRSATVCLATRKLIRILAFSEKSATTSHWNAENSAVMAAPCGRLLVVPFEFSPLHVDSLPRLPENPRLYSKIEIDSSAFPLNSMVTRVLSTELLCTVSLPSLTPAWP